MSSWQPSRSPSPPYRNRRYSPSRAVSPPPTSLPPPPARRYDGPVSGGSWRGEEMARPMRSEHFSPPRSARPLPPSRDDRYAPAPPVSRSRSPSPRYRGRRTPPPMYRDRAYSPPPSDRYRPSPPPPPPRRRNRPGAADFYDDPPRERDSYELPRTGRSMAADWEEDRTRDIPPPRQLRAQDQWERGQEPPYEQGGHGYGDEGYADEWRDNDHGRNKSGRGPSAPYRDVIFLGLDDELTETDFTGFLNKEHQARVVSVKIVRDRVTGKSKNFGFAQFATVEDAEDFVLPNFPYIQMPALYAHSEARRVKIDFSTPVGVPNSGSADPAAQADHTQFADFGPARRHDGTRDIGTPGGGKRVLLLRMLDWSTRGDEIIWRLTQEIARMIGKQGREQEAEQSIVRVATIHDKVGRGASWGFAFVELVTTELAAALLSFLLSPQSQPNGFLIADRPIGVSFANPGAFTPVPAGPLGGQFLLRATRNGGIGCETVEKPDGAWCAYFHENAGAVEVLPESRPPIGEDGNIPALSDELRSLLGGLAGKTSPDKEASGAATAQPTAGLVSISNVMQPIKIGTSFGMPKTTRKADEAGLGARDGRNVLEDEDEEQDLIGKDTVLLSRTKGAHIVPPTSGSRKIAKNISKWNNKQTELATPEPAIVKPKSNSGGGSGGGPPKGISSANAIMGSTPRIQTQAARTPAASRPADTPSTSGTGRQAQSSSPAPTADDFDYSEAQTDGKVACLLCQRKLPSIDVLRKHVASSDLHKTNLANPDTVAAGRKRKEQASRASGSVSASGSAESDLPKYRDRAAERREVFHQPEKPSYMDRMALSKASSSSGPPKRKFAEGPKAPSPPPEPGLAPGQDESNKGNALLTKMGWASGTGLGKGSEGRVAPIEVKQLQERAGLGAAKR